MQTLLRFPGLVALIAATFLPVALRAQPATGAIAGRILNPATGEYVRNATIEIKATGQTAVSGDGGEYHLLAVPAGPATVTVNYTGYQAAPATIEVTGGATVTQDFSLFSTATDSGAVTKLDKFVVSTAREGQAKALMDERNAMNITNTVASDTFGDNPEGNVAEFVRFLPGVDLDSNFGEGRYVNLRGLGSEYTAVTMDGMQMASTDASNTGGAAAARSFSFEQVAMSSMDAIEISKTISADMDANAPAGTINLRSKRAFDRKGRRLSFALDAALHSSAFTLGKTDGPGHAGETYKIRPGGTFNYSDTFLDGRLGVALALSESNIYEETDKATLAYNRTPTAADPRPQVISSIALQSSRRFYERSAATLTVDYRANPNLVFGVTFAGNTSTLWTPAPTMTLTTGTRTAITGDGLTNFSTNATNAAIAITSNPMTYKLGKSLMISPNFEWTLGKLSLDGRFSYSSATSWYDNLSKNMIYQTGSISVAGANFSAVRSSPLAGDWRLTQTSGNDIANPASFPTGTFQIGDGRWAKQDLYNLLLNATLPTTVAGVPIVWKTGAKINWQSRSFDNPGALTKYTYNGPTTPAYWTDKVSDFVFSQRTADRTLTSISGGRTFMPDPNDAYADWLAHPNNYTHVLAAADAYAAWVTNHQRFSEEVDAGYLMGTAQLMKSLSLRAGLRYEKTTNIALQPDSYTATQVQAAGYPVSASSGQATTVDGIYYQFMSRPWQKRRTSFDNLFPSASLKYLLPWNTDLSFGFSTTIRRAPYSYLSGVYLINDENQTVTVTNPALKPENGQNFALRLAHYWEPLGMIGVSLFENKVKNQFESTTVSAQEFGNTDPTLANYNFTTTVNSADRTNIRGLEIEFSQNLGFLSKELSRFTVTASYTHNHTDDPQLTGLVPSIVNGGINFTWRRFNLNFNGNWVDNTFSAIGATNTWSRHRLHANAGASVQLSQRLTLSVTARNVLNTPRITMQQAGANTPVMTIREDNGVTTTFALKATF